MFIINVVNIGASNMRIAINLSIVRQQGLHRYLHGFIPALGKCGSEDNFLVFLPEQEKSKLVAQLPDKFVLRGTNFGTRVWKRVLWEQFVLPRIIRSWKADVLFSPFDITPMFFSPAVLGVRNPSPLLLQMGLVENSSGVTQARIHYALSWMSCRKAHAVFYPSQYAARHLGDIMGIQAEKRSTIYHGVDQAFWGEQRENLSVLRKYQVQSRRYFIFVSNLYRYKHPEVLVEAFRKLEDLQSLSDYRVLLVGECPDKEFEKDLQKLITTSGLVEKVGWLRNIPSSDLASLYQECLAMVLPTTMETFGQPFVEAMVAGAAILTADTKFAREICGDAAWYFPANDCEALGGLMLRSVEDSLGIERLRASGKRQSQNYSWQREASETLALLKRVGVGSSSR